MTQLIFFQLWQITVICAFGFYLFLTVFIVIYGLKLNCLWRTRNSFDDRLDEYGFLFLIILYLILYAKFQINSIITRIIVVIIKQYTVYYDYTRT